LSNTQPMPQPEILAAYAICRAVAKREAKNFYYAFRVLPRHKSDAMCAVYAFMRKADDLADDESHSLDVRRQAMAAWTAEWRASRTEPTTDPIFLALLHTQKTFNIPDDLLEQLVAGTTLDLNPQPEGVLTLTLYDEHEQPLHIQIYELLLSRRRGRRPRLHPHLRLLRPPRRTPRHRHRHRLPAHQHPPRRPRRRRT